MQFFTLTAALFLGSAAAMSPEMMNNKMGEANMKMDMAARQEMAPQGGATLGTLLAAVDTIVGQVADQVKDLKEPATALQDAIKDFEDAAKDAEVPEGDKKDN
ncbi:uncharacterized protein J7T54_003927 [Emericellopsis cladophorae]|uniref:Uncharacterized protein n=1 Tax=Emericellopsis cladophorae TaxID=2686198 RepID=A0A9P9Y1A3_9HYPO|nr:uncharacterized protein J7T54_003927 [Emericellopsis cladophorae]KAI6781662.1 hypothetical protein J7T54_003927 [Emericellopsis cladophorae]